MTLNQKQNKELMLQVDSLSKSFGELQVLYDVTLKIPRGQLVCFLGPSGCGKTTLLRLVAGLETSTTGEIYINGENVTHKPVQERNTSIVFQSYALFPNLTVLQNIKYGLDKLPHEEAQKLALDLIDMVGMNDKIDFYPSELSGGQQQRVALARALAINPHILLLDEPLSALDKQIREHLREQIKSIQTKLNITTIMVTHDQEEALSMADVIVVLNEGNVEQIGTPNEIYKSPATEFVVNFIGNMTALPPSVTKGKKNVAIHAEDCVTKKYTKTGSGHAGTILSLEFLGANNKLKVQMDDGFEVTSILFHDSPLCNTLAVGDKVKIEFPEKKYCIYA